MTRVLLAKDAAVHVDPAFYPVQQIETPTFPVQW